MKQITLPLNEYTSRPVVKIRNIFYFDAMLDTGALLPVWTYKVEFLEKIGGVFSRPNFTFGGFGGNVQGNLYHIPTFKIGDLIFPHLPVVVAKIKVPCYMILSATMFSRLIYEIDDVHHKLNITIPDHQSAIRNISVRDENGRFRLVCTNGEETEN